MRVDRPRWFVDSHPRIHTKSRNCPDLFLMTPDRWRQVTEILDAALARPVAERDAFLASACGGDAELLAWVALMLSKAAEENLSSDHTAVLDVGSLAANNETESFAGRVFGHYRLDREIGRGGMGQVYLAHDTRLKRRVALKLLPPSFSENPLRIGRFQQEALAVSALNHPNIITIHEIGESDGLRFIVTEFVDGQTLGDIIGRGQNDLNNVIRIIMQVAEALSAAHGAGIIHRDIKPANIMVRRDGYVKVLDFGLAKLSEEPQGVDATLCDINQVTTTPGTLLGTTKYMSPEQARGYSVDARTDIFSLGVVLYEAVTGQATFQGDTKVDVLIALAGKEPPPIFDYLPEAPPQLQQIIDRALKKNREERYQTAEEMRLDLEELKEALGPGLMTSRSSQSAGAVIRSRTSAHRIPRPTESIRQKSKLVPVALWILPALIIAAVMVGAYQWWYRARPHAFENIEVRRLTNLGQARFGAISPDGKFLGYAVRDETGGSFWLKQQGASATRVVMPPRSSVELWALDFSADSNYFYYLIEDVTNRIGGTLYRVPVLGGEPHKVIAGLKAGSFSVSPNDQQILFPRVREEANPVELTVVDLDSRHERVIKQVAADRCGPLAWSPESQSITMVARERDAAGSYWQLVEISLADGLEKPLSLKYRTQPPRSLSWLRDRSALIFIGLDEASGAYQVWQMGFPDAELRRVTHDLHDYARVSVTSDGKSIVTAQNDFETAIWVGPLASSPAVAADSRAITSNVSRILGVASTPDGKIIYAQATNNTHDLWEVNPDGSSARQLTASAGRNIHPSVSADGRYVVFTSNRSGRDQIWRIDRDGSNPLQLTNGEFDANFAHCSPAGSTVVFAARVPWAIWSVPLQGGPVTRLGESYESTPAISPDAHMVAYEYVDKTAKRTKLCVQPIEGGPITTIADSDVGYSNIRWTIDGKAIAYVSNREGRTNIWAQPLTGGSPKKLTDFKTEWLMRFDWSRDGKQFICVRGRQTSDLFLIRNSSAK